MIILQSNISNIQLIMDFKDQSNPAVLPTSTHVN